MGSSPTSTLIGIVVRDPEGKEHGYELQKYQRSKPGHLF